MIVGGKVVSGKMKNGENLEVLRDDKVLGRGKLSIFSKTKSMLTK